MKKYRVYAVLMAFTWMFVSGSISPEAFFSGLLIGFPISYGLRRFYPGEISIGAVKRTPYLVVYVLHFLKELIISNLEVTYRVLYPGAPAKSDVIEYSMDIQDPTAITMLANSITLTPGTLVIDHLEEDNTLLVHCLHVGSEEEQKKGISYWENLLKKIFGEEK